jgi:uncharacterized integral membrane protein
MGLVAMELEGDLVIITVVIWVVIWVAIWVVIMVAITVVIENTDSIQLIYIFFCLSKP